MSDSSPFAATLPTNSYVDAYAPPAQNAPAPSQAAAVSPALVPAQSSSAPVSNAPASTGVTSNGSAAQPEALADQNIFHMLGVADGTEEQKEAFLDELQQVIWEDFLESDVQLLIPEAEYQQLQAMLKERQTVDLEQQEKMVVFLEKLIPDLEEIMLEKALELKADMFRERIAGLREYFASQPEKLAAIDQAEQLMLTDRWRSAADQLNAL